MGSKFLIDPIHILNHLLHQIQPNRQPQIEDGRPNGMQLYNISQDNMTDTSIPYQIHPPSKLTGLK
jgi:hypothetical protein